MALTDIQAAGWRGTYASPPASFDPVGAPETLNVTRSGFDATGAAASPVDVITIMSRVRQPYPDHETLTANDVSLSDFIYAGDTISGVTNNSTLAAPLPISMWLDHDLQRCTTGTYTAKLAVAHAHGRNGRPVAAVKFIATDGTTTVEQTVSTMTSTSYPVSGLTVPHFEADLDFSTLTDNAMITIDAIIYPWVGPAYQASVDGATYPSINFTIMKVLNDVSYGTSYAYVDSASGNDGTGVVSETPATAQASPYATIAAAAFAIQTYNDANLGRDSASGGIIRLEDGDHQHGAYSGVDVSDIPLVIEAADPADKATTVYREPLVNELNDMPLLVKLKDITLGRSSSAKVVFLDCRAFDTANGYGSALILENCGYDAAGHGAGTEDPKWIFAPGRIWMIGCEISNREVLSTSGSTRQKAAISIGSKVPAGNCLYSTAGCDHTGDSRGFSTSSFGVNNLPVLRGSLISHCYMSVETSSAISLHSDPGIYGMAVVGCITEMWGSGSTPALDMQAPTVPFQNIVMQGNAIEGERSNVAYLDTATGNNRKVVHSRNNVFEDFNTKSDVNDDDGSLVGDWSIRHRVSIRHNAYRTGEFTGPVENLGEFLGLGETLGSDADPIDPDYADNAGREGGGDNTGGGDYRIGPDTELQTIPAGETTYPVDLYGNVIKMDGTAYVGATQLPTAASEDATATPGAGTVSGSGAVPTISAGAEASPAVGAGGLLGLAPSVTTAAASAPVTGSSAELGFAPLISAASSATPAPGEGSGIGREPALSASSRSSPSAGALAGIGFAPSVGAQSIAIAAPAAGAGSALGRVPALSASSRSSPAAGTVAGAGFAPTATAGSASDAFPATGASLGGGFGPAISTGSAARPTRGVSGAAGFAPSVSANGNATAAPAAGSAQGSGLSPVTGTGVLVATGAGSAASGGFAPLVSANASSAPGAGSIVGLGFAPAALGLGAENPDYVFAADSARTGTILNPRRDGK